MFRPVMSCGFLQVTTVNPTRFGCILHVSKDTAGRSKPKRRSFRPQESINLDASLWLTSYRLAAAITVQNWTNLKKLRCDTEKGKALGDLRKVLGELVFFDDEKMISVRFYEAKVMKS